MSFTIIVLLASCSKDIQKQSVSTSKPEEINITATNWVQREAGVYDCTLLNWNGSKSIDINGVRVYFVDTNGETDITNGSAHFRFGMIEESQSATIIRVTFRAYDANQNLPFLYLNFKVVFE
jgi:hypothetical protein